MTDLTATLRVLTPAPGVHAYYDGRIIGRRLYKEAPNWLDDGAYALGIAAYSIVDGDEALIFDSHISLDHAAFIRAHVEGLGARRLRLVLSHWHDDHVAGNAVFEDSEILAHRLTAARLADNRAKFETDDPPIRPLVMPSRVYDDALAVTVGRRSVELRHFEIHSSDATVLLLPAARLLLAGDVVEDTVTYIAEAARTDVHIAELARLATLPFDRILPAHGAPEVIAAGGYTRALIDANAGYLKRLRVVSAGGKTVPAGLRDFIAADIASGRVGYFEPYEAVHWRNVERMRAAFAPVP